MCLVHAVAKLVSLTAACDCLLSVSIRMTHVNVPATGSDYHWIESADTAFVRYAGLLSVPLTSGRHNYMGCIVQIPQSYLLGGVASMVLYS